MQDPVVIDSLKKLQLKGSDLSEEFNSKLSELYKWYNDQLNLISDDMLHILNNPKSSNKTSINNENPPDICDNGPRLKSREPTGEFDIIFTKSSPPDKIINVDNPEHATKSWPKFWLHALLGCKTTRLWISEKDYDILEYLNDIRVEVFDSNEIVESFEVTFYFNENPYFSNSKLWRSFDFDRNLITSESSEIYWTSEIEYEDLKFAICIKDKIRRNPLKYVLRYQSELSGDKEQESDTDDEEYSSTKAGSRYPFSWLFQK
uniref:Nucleosome assembly protein 1, putative n=1 Tax=Theileria parva TaxID=5875 RepID=Q4N2Z7_THEPA|eukprot:XP_763830.1 nucleosome assembly protein 1 [Theileria parva strain Muguga]